MKTTLFIHHSADPFQGPQFAKTYDYHNRGAPRADGSLKWPTGHGIQYHYFDDVDGEMKTGMPPDRIAWHSGNQYWNANALAVCVAGDLTKTVPSDRQLASLYSLWKELDYPTIMLHKEVRGTTCPGNFDFRAELKRRYYADLRQRLKNAVHALPRFVGTPRGSMLSRLIDRLRKTKGVE